MDSRSFASITSEHITDTPAVKSQTNSDLLQDIAKYILKYSSTTDTAGQQDAQANPKKRKLVDDGTNVLPVVGSQPKKESKAQFQVKDVSFSIPQRKKLNLELSKDRVQLRNPTSGEVEVSEDIRRYGENCATLAMFVRG